MARREITGTQTTTGSRREVAGQTPTWEQLFGGSGNAIEENPIYKALNFLTFGTPEGAKKAVASPTFFGTGDTANPIKLAGQFLKETSPATVPAMETAATYYGGAKLLKALTPYLTYGGVNKLKDTLASKDPNAWTGKDIQDSLVEKLTAGNKLGNVKSEVETFVNDLLTKRMPGGFSNQQTYGTGEMNQLAKNIGTAEQGGYDYSSVPGMVRSAATSLVKDVAPATRLPYQAATFLSKIGSVPGAGFLLKNPITWPVAAWGAEKVPGVIRSIFK